MSRQIELEPSTNWRISAAQHLVDDGCMDPYREIQHAIGYLATWAEDAYPICVISTDGETDLTARYFRAESSPFGRGDYVIGAIWHGAHYGFHS